LLSADATLLDCSGLHNDEASTMNPGDISTRLIIGMLLVQTTLHAAELHSRGVDRTFRSAMQTPAAADMQTPAVDMQTPAVVMRICHPRFILYIENHEKATEGSVSRSRSLQATVPEGPRGSPWSRLLT